MKCMGTASTIMDKITEDCEERILFSKERCTFLVGRHLHYLKCFMRHTKQRTKSEEPGNKTCQQGLATLSVFECNEGAIFAVSLV